MPSNWQQVAAANNSITYAPQGAYFQGTTATRRSRTASRSASRRARATCSATPTRCCATSRRGTRDLRQQGNSKNDSVGGRSGITIPLANVSEVTGQPEYISLSTTQLRDGSLLYVIGVAPRTEAGTYDNTFKKIRQSIQISDK